MRRNNMPFLKICFIKPIMFCILGLLLLLPTAHAEIEQQTLEGPNCTVDYPKVILINKAAEERINQDILEYVQEFENTTEGLAKGRFRYKLKSETDAYISLVFVDFRYSAGAAHGNTQETGIVYSKQTGEHIPLSDFANVTKEDLSYLLHTGHLYNASGEQVEWGGSFFGDIRRVPQDYYLTEDGRIFVIFHPYELTCYADGGTRLDITDWQEIPHDDENSAN